MAAGSPLAPKSDTNDVRFGSFLSTLILMCTVMVIGIVNQTPGLLPKTELTSERTAYAELVPEEWAFFARLAESDMVLAYRVEPSGTSVDPTVASLTSITSWWGLRRTTDATVLETAYLASAVPDSSWIPCQGLDVTACRQATPSAFPVPIANRLPGARLCGQLVLAVLGPVGSTATQRDGRLNRTVAKVVDVSVSCQ